MTIKYPTEPPIESVRVLFEILTGRRDRDIPLAAFEAWKVQGYLQGLILGDPQTAGIASLSPEPVHVNANISDAQGVAILGALVELEASSQTNSGDLKASGLGDLLGGALRRQLAGLILPLLTRWLQEFLEEGGLNRVIDRILNPSGVRASACRR